MKLQLFLIANSTEARLFSRAAANDPLVPLATFDDADGRLQTSFLADDRAGHGSNVHRPGGVAFTRRVDPRRKKHLQFARLLAHELDEQLATGRYGELVVFASCPFLGELKSELRPRTRSALGEMVDLDLTSYALSELEQRIDHALRH